MALVLEYNGSKFHGWQIQPGLPTIQGELEKALTQIADHPVSTVCAGRTDQGVHARYQVVHFDTHAIRSENTWLSGVNHFLPKDIAVHKAVIMPENFHARFMALNRSYEYWIDNRSIRPGLEHQKVTWIARKLNPCLMQEAAQYLLGEHDFSAFRAAICQAKNSIRRIFDIQVIQKDHYIIIKICANAFLHHMVRNIVGTLLPIGLGFKNPETILDVLHSKKRKNAGKTMLPDGLYLSSVVYPEEFQKKLGSILCQKMLI